jgi:hypothetical protein
MVATTQPKGTCAMRSSEFRDLLVKHLNDNPLPGVESQVDAIDDADAIGIDVDGALFFLTIDEA